MGDVIRFPVERTRPHVALSWDWAWDQYRIQAHGVSLPRGALEWCDNIDEAWDRFIGMGERLQLPLVYCLKDGQVA
jgi:hypothetical protein